MVDYARFKALAERGFAAQGRANPNGQFAALRQMVDSGDPWAPDQTPAYTTLELLDIGRKQTFMSGTLVAEENATIYTSPPASVVIATGEDIALGIKAEAAGESSPWRNIVSAEPFAPGGIVLYYEIKLAY